MARFVEPMLVDGRVGLVLAPGGRLERALRVRFANGKIAEVEIIGEPGRLQEIELAVLE
jgi:RNA polymerase sigma-70 factor (ECF subfamily)